MLLITRAALSTCVLLLIFPGLSACGMSRQSESGSVGRVIRPDGVSPSFDSILPPPSALLPLLGGDKQVSYSELDYIRHGREFDPGLPLCNASIWGDMVEFSPDWSVGTGMKPENLGFCCFTFSNVNGYTRDPELRYGLTHAPADIGTAWLALAHWDSDCWVWHQCTPAGVFAVPTFTPYISSAHELVAAMVMANAETTTLRWIRLGPPLLSAHLVANPSRGIAPMDVTLDASGSTEGVGTATTYHFDLDGDGDYEAGGMIPNWDVTVPAPGEYNYNLLVRSSYGIEDTAGTTSTGLGLWAHSWGTGGADTISAVTTDGQEYIYVVGTTKSSGPAKDDVLVLKYGVNGTLVWARHWGGTDRDFGLSAAFADQSLYVGGATQSFGVGTKDALIQRWDTDGNVLWSFALGYDSEDSYATIEGISVSGSKLYLAGAQSWVGSDPAALVLQCDEAGSILWGKLWFDSIYNVAKAIAAQYNFMTQTTTLHIAGARGEDLLYLSYSDEGDLLSSRVWTGDTSQRGTCISVYGGLPIEIFIGGWVISSTDYDVLLLKTSDGMAKRWGGSSDESVGGMLRHGDTLYLCGRSDSFHPSQAGLFLRCTADGVLEDLRFWKSDSVDEGLGSICRFPGSGIILGGTCASADGGGWAPASDVFSDQPGTWTDATGQVYDYNGETTAASASAQAITGLVDMGGGDKDGLVAVRSF